MWYSGLQNEGDIYAHPTFSLERSTFPHVNRAGPYEYLRILETYYEKGKHKQGESRNVLVVLGVAMANGWPIARHVFPGNTADNRTFASVVEDLEGRFGLRRVLVVGDCGLVSPDNLEFLSAQGRQVRPPTRGPRKPSRPANSSPTSTDAGAC